MFDKLFEFFSNLISEVVPLFIVREYEEAVLLRRGKFKKTLKAGLYTKWPFMDDVLKDLTVVTTFTLPVQSLVTKDGKDIVVKGMIRYKITDIRAFLLGANDIRDVISDSTQGVIAEVISNLTWQDCQNVEINNTITKKVRVKTKRFGIDVEECTLTDKTSTRSIRLFNENIINN